MKQNERKTQYEQDRYMYTYMRHIELACLQDLRDAIPHKLIIDLQDEDNNLQVHITTNDLLQHMEKAS